MSIIDAIIKATAQRYHVRMIIDSAEAKRLGCKIGDYVREPVKMKIMPEVRLSPN